MSTFNRKASRVRFEMGYPASIMGIDGTWRRDCLIEDVSDTGARLSVGGDIEGLNLKEFFLVLSRTGCAYRRCELVWFTGDTVGLRFVFAKPTAGRADGKYARRELSEV